MNTFLIKYNPYTVETEILWNKVPVAENSILNIKNKRLQQWINNAPSYLSEECNSKNFKVEFLGTKMDFEDLKEAVEMADQNFNIELKHIPVIELENVEEEIENIFYKITHGPIEELKSKKLKEAFYRVLHDEFDITVMATMSSGKSTLINALLQQDIMPSSQEASTATIISIKDKQEETFTAEAFNKDNQSINRIVNVSLQDLERLNQEQEVSKINISGNIPFSSQNDETTLVLIDTPGPNNSRDENHYALFERTLNESSNSLVLYILNASQFGINDDKELLEKIANNMKNGDKQSSDKYIFVVNKIDTFDSRKDDVSKTLKETHDYLASFGIDNANVFPASALTALQIRNVLNNIAIRNEWTTEEVYSVEDANHEARRLNRDPQLHLEKYSQYNETVPLNTDFNLDISSDKRINLKNLETALLHTGIPSIEAHINLYLSKYAKTIKIKNLTDVFLESLENSKIMETLKKDIFVQKDQHEAIRTQIEGMQENLNSDEEAIKFKNEIGKIDVSSEVDNMIKKYKSKFGLSIDESVRLFGKSINEDKGKEINLSEAQKIADDLVLILTKLYTSFNLQLEENINRIMSNTSNRLLDEYKKKIAHLDKKSLVDGIILDPIELIGGELTIESSAIMEDKIQTRKVKVGEEHIKNPEKTGFLGALKFWKKRYITKTIYENEQYIDYIDLRDGLITEVDIHMQNVFNDTKTDVKSNVKELKFAYNIKFDEINKLLQERLEELKKFTTQSDEINERLKNSENNLEWLKDVQEKLDSITRIERKDLT